MIFRMMAYSVGGIALVGLVIGGLALSAHADTPADRLVDMLTSSSSYRVRAQSALSLGRLGQLGTVAALIDALDDEHPMVRASAAIALGRIGSSRAEPALARVASDPNQPEEVSTQAMYALERIRRFAAR